ncbi:MAG: RNA polymerase sigma factor region1.1 domain-containing protein, partial [Steroidobacteraceae bacterium]
MSKKSKATASKKPARPVAAKSAAHKAAPKKAASKPAPAKTAPKKPVAKVASKPSPKATKPAAKSVAKPAVKPAAKPVAKVTAKPASKPAAKAPVAKAVPAPAPKTVATKPAPAAKKAPKSEIAQPAAAPVVATPPAQPTAKPTAKQSKAAKAAANDGNKPLNLPERRPLAMPEERQSQLKQLIALGKEQSYLTYSQVNDYLPSEIVDPEQIEEIVNTINDMGIPVYEKAPEESLLAPETTAPSDEEAIEEAAAALAALDAELGRTTDPVRMYMREMGTVELLTREGEISIAKRIEEGLDAVRTQISLYPPTYDFILKAYEPVKNGAGRLADIIVGFIDPNAPDVIAQPQNPTKVDPAAAAAEESEEADGGDDEEEAADTGPDPIE